MRWSRVGEAAEAIRKASRRPEPYQIIDCSAIAPNLAESALFGHVRGAFSGATQNRVSPFVQADGGTVFIDEIGDLPLDPQPKLLRALANGELKPVGSNKTIKFNVRIIAATCKDLSKAVADGTFRLDLYHRLGEARVVLPPLRARLEDIPLLVREMCIRAGKAEAFDRICQHSLDRLAAVDWEGNVRQLESRVKFALGVDKGGVIDIATLPGTSALWEGKPVPSLRDVEDAALGPYLARLTAYTGGNLSEMSRLAGVHRDTMRQLLRRFGLWGEGGDKGRRGGNRGNGSDGGTR